MRLFNHPRKDFTDVSLSSYRRGEGILHSHVRLDHGVTRTVQQLLDESDDTTQPLEAVGIRTLVTDDGVSVLFIHPGTVSRYLLRDSQFAGHALRDYLLRLPGAKDATQRLKSKTSPQGKTTKGIIIPMTTVDGIHNTGNDGGSVEPGTAGAI